MRKQISRFTLRNSISLAFLLMAGAAFLVSVPLVSSWTQPAEKSGAKLKTASPYLKLRENRQLEAVYIESSSVKGSLQPAAARSTPDQGRAVALTSADLNSDGYPDLVGGYSISRGGLLTVHQGDPRAFAPSDPAVLRGIARGEFPDPFLKKVTVFEIPEAPDFLNAGDFNRDGSIDVIAAARGGNGLYLLSGDGNGGFSSTRRIEVSGALTAMAAGNINQHDGGTDLVVGVNTSEGPLVHVYQAPKSIEAALPLSYALPGEAKSFVFGRLDDDSLGDLAIAAGGRLLILHGSDRSSTGSPSDTERARSLDTVNLSFEVNAIALGEFIWDRDSRTEISVLDQDGAVHILARGPLDTRPMTADELRDERLKLARLQDKARQRGEPLTALATRTEAASTWEVAESLPGSADPGRGSSPPSLVSTRISALPSDDLLIINGTSHDLQVMYREESRPGRDNVAGQSAVRSSASIETGEIAAVLPMRLNVDGRPGLVIMNKGKGAPSFMMQLAATTFTVTRADDPAPNGCLVGDCSLREAIIDSNANIGADTIVFDAGINPTLTITSGGSFENAAATGDLDIEDSLTITGNNQTVISTNYTSTCGDCKVFGVAQNGTTGLTVSFSGVTIQNGFNNGANFQGTFFDTGGGVDFFLSGSGNSYSMTDSVITNNNVTGSFLSHGGGINVDSFNTASAGGPSAGTVTLTGCTLSGNTAQESGAGVTLAADKHDVVVTNCAVTGNIATNADGGGIWIRHSFGGTVAISGASGSVSNNSGTQGAGISIIGSQVTNISGITVGGNTATGAGSSSLGGGILISTLGADGVTGGTTLTGVTISSNHADNGTGAQGGGLYFNSFYAASTSNCSIGGNTSKSGAGVFNGGSTATPQAILSISSGSITGNTASVSGGGVGSLAGNTTLSKVTLTGNSATTSGGGFFVSGGTVIANFCRVVANTAPTGSGLARTGGTATVEDNWWGTNTPATVISGTADFDPWLKLTHTASPNPVLRNCASTLTASFLVKSDGALTSASNLDVLIGLPVTFNNAVLGTISTPQPAIQASGAATATYTAGAIGGNGSADATVDGVTVTAPIQVNEPPAITCPPDIIMNTDPGLCTAVTTFSPTFTGFPVPTVVCIPASGSAFPHGTTTVTCTASNGISPDATCESPGSAPDPSCSFTVTVVDNQPPNVICPANITTNTDAGLCTAVVNYATPAGSDNCPGVTVLCSPASGTAFSKGTTTVTCTATDASSLTASCSFTVTVNDNEPPTIGACPSPITTNSDPNQCSAIVTYATPSGNDNCPGVMVACSPASGTPFPKGTTTVTCTATDASSLTATCSFTVTVNDNQPPAITCPGNITTTENPPGSGCATVTYTTPTPTDNCPGATANCAPASGTCFPIGSTPVTCTATDTSGNTSSCMFTVTVQVACTITCPANITTGNNPNQCGAIVNYPAPTTTAGCGAVLCSPASGSFFPVGSTPVSCTTIAGPSCGFTVTVVDNQPPSIVCPANVSATAATGQTSAIVNYPAPTVSDNCPGVSFVCAPASGSSFPLGTTTVTCTATDAHANQASCSFAVSVSSTFLVNADSFLRDGAGNTNEGGNNLLRIQSAGHNRVVVRFNLSGVSTSGLQSATLILNITENSDNWGPTGRLVDAHRLLADWTEGNGHTVGSQPNFRGTGEGVTWNCAKDADISNMNDDCASQWNGGTFAAATASPVLHLNGQMGDVSWNVTADVLAGANNGWVIKKQNEGQAGQVRYFSKEGAAAAGNPNVAPRLVLVYAP